MTLSGLFSTPIRSRKSLPPEAERDPNATSKSPTSVVKKFWARFQRESYIRDGLEVACLVWPVEGAHDSSGYGVVKWRGKATGVHKLAYALHHGIEPNDITPGLEVLHACDNPPCGEESHLSLGTKADNMQDAKRRGRKY